MKKLRCLLIVLTLVLAGCGDDRRSGKTTIPNCDQILDENVVAGMPCSPIPTPTQEAKLKGE